VPSCSSQRAAGHARCRGANPTPGRTTSERLSGRPDRKRGHTVGAGGSWSKHVSGEPPLCQSIPPVGTRRVPVSPGRSDPCRPGIRRSRRGGMGSARARASRLG
jgi:hypothetical protein